MNQPPDPEPPDTEDPDAWIDYMIEESFPASDPPGHGGVEKPVKPGPKDGCEKH